MITLTPGAATLADLATIYTGEHAVRLDRAARPAVERAAEAIAKAAAGDAPVYGVNTGFGKLASMRIAPKDTATLQRNLILSHCCGVGAPIPRAHARLMMALKLLSLGRGASGVRWELIELLEGMLERGVTPVIPAQGSVGASGDLAPLAHMTAVIIGAGEAEFGGDILPGAEALAKAGLAPIQLGPKEGLAFINGTQFSTAFALAGLFDGWRAAQAALVTSALSTDAIMGSTAPLQPEIHALRGHPARSRPQQPCAPFLTAPRSARATARAIPACRTPIASAASRRLPAPRWMCCAWPPARWRSRPTPPPTIRSC